MIVLSFDVGIANISYSLLDVASRECFRVVDWRLVNLVEGAVPLAARCGLECWQCGGRAVAEECSQRRACCREHLESKSEKGLYEVKCALVQSLARIELEGVERVLIENQPSLKNPRMKSIAETVYAYFLIKKLERDLPYDLHYVAPSKKNQLEKYVVVELAEEERQRLAAKKGYVLGKAQAVAYCGWLLGNRCSNGEEWARRWVTYKKRDDLADSLLQAIVHYLSH